MEFVRKYSIQITLLTATLLIILLAMTGTDSSSKQPGKKGIKYGKIERISNESVREIQIKYTMTEMKNQASPGIEPKPGAGEDHVPNVVNMQPNSVAFDADENVEKTAPTLDAKMERFLAEREKFEEMEKIKRQEYVELFKEQAAQMGYEVEINDEMEIVKVRKTGAQ